MRTACSIYTTRSPLAHLHRRHTRLDGSLKGTTGELGEAFATSRTGWYECEV